MIKWRAVSQKGMDDLWMALYRDKEGCLQRTRRAAYVAGHKEGKQMSTPGSRERIARLESILGPKNTEACTQGDR